MPADVLLSPTTPLTVATLRHLLSTNTRVVLAADTYPTEPTGAALPAAELLAHACGAGAEVPVELVRLLLLLRVRSLAPTAATAATAQRLLDFYNREILPVVYQQGGEAVALAHLCLPLLGQGEVNYQGYRLQAADVLHLFSWAPLTLTVDETTALLTGPVLTLAYAVHGLLRTGHLSRATTGLATLLPAAEASTQTALENVTRAALADVQRVVEAACTTQIPVEEDSILLALDTLRLAAVRLGELTAQRTEALLTTLDATSPLQYLQLTVVDIRQQNRQLRLVATLQDVLDNVEQLLGLELLVAARLQTAQPPTPMLVAFQEKVTQVSRGQMPTVALRAAAAFVRNYDWQ